MIEILTAIVSPIKQIIELIGKVIVWRSRRSKERQLELSTRDASGLLSRFLSLFRTMDIPRPLIPRFLGANDLLTVQQACSDELLSAALTDDLILRTGKRLAVPSEWLYGATSRRYIRHFNYKNIPGALALFEQILTDCGPGSYAEEFVLVANGSMEAPDGNGRRMLAVFRCTLEQIEGKDLERVYVLEDDLPWDHGPARFYSKQLVLLAMTLGVPVRGVAIEPDRFRAFENDELFAHQLFQERRTIWHPDDFVVLSEDSHVAVDRDEAVRVRSSFKASWLHDAAGIRRTLVRSDLYSGLVPSADAMQ